MTIEESGIGLSFEVLLGILAITTFLVGFSTVRLQASLQEWRERGERVVDRLLDQNNNDDLLPLPSTLHTLGGSSKKLKVDSITWISLSATVLSAVLCFLVAGHLSDTATGVEYTLLTWLSFLVSLILFAGFIDIAVVKSKARAESRHSPARIFAHLEIELLAWSRGAEQNYFRSGKIANLCAEFEELIPDWCWMTLIRYDLQTFHHPESTPSSQVAFSSDGLDVRVAPTWLVRLATFQFNAPREQIDRGFNPVLLQPSVERISRMSQEKPEDWYSLIAHIWSTSLLQATSLKPNVELPPITMQQLILVNTFRQQTNDALAELALRCFRRVSDENGHFPAELKDLYVTFHLPSLEKVNLRDRSRRRMLDRIRPLAPGLENRR